MRRAPWILLTLTAACGETAATVDVAALTAPGPHAVGHRIVDVDYQPPLFEGTRSLAVHVWYPAEATEGERPLYVVKRSDVAVEDAPPKALGPRPVLLFSHGHQAYAAALSYLMEHLASHGYLVVAPTHTGNTFLDGDRRETSIYYLRSFDVRASLDHLLALTGDPLAGLVDASKVAVSGHSFGGYTAMAVGGATFPVEALAAACPTGQVSAGWCSTLGDEEEALFAAGLGDARVRAIVSLDPGDFELFGAAGVAAVDHPVLHVVAEASGNPPKSPSADEYWSALDGADDLRLLLVGGDHNDFTDGCANGLDIRCSTIPGPQVWLPVRAYTLAFLRAHLEGDTSVAPLLDGTQTISERFEASVHGR
ncbi:alpha/beta hydrolase [Myxococcota bacterium]|nr:alpha/beta hydrolase [Myxococcota bacterium]